MGLSVHVLNVIIFFVILLHVGGAFVYFQFYLFKLKDPDNIEVIDNNESNKKKFTVSSKTQGILNWVLMGLIPLSWILSLIAVDSCSFLKVTINREIYTLQRRDDFGLGFRKFYIPYDVASGYGSGGGCATFKSSDEFVNYATPLTAYHFMVFNILLTTVGMLLLGALQCFVHDIVKRERCWLALKIVMYISLWCALFSFYVQEAPMCDLYDCTLGTIGILHVFNVLFLIGISIFLSLSSYGENVPIDACRQSAENAVHKKATGKNKGDDDDDEIESPYK